MIASEGEQKASKALKEAADIIATSPAALQLRWTLFFLNISNSNDLLKMTIFSCRYLQTLNSISAEKNSTIIFPLPMELLGAFGGNGGERQLK